MMFEGLILPALVLGAAAFAVPRVLARFLPEGVGALMLNALLATLVMCGLSAGVFFGLYVWQGADAAQLAGQGLGANIVYFGRLGLSSALIWAPLLILSVAGLPRKWVRETW